jgi:hypothetical protein
MSIQEKDISEVRMQGTHWPNILVGREIASEHAFGLAGTPMVVRIELDTVIPADVFIDGKPAQELFTEDPTADTLNRIRNELGHKDRSDLITAAFRPPEEDEIGDPRVTRLPPRIEAWDDLSASKHRSWKQAVRLILDIPIITTDTRKLAKMTRNELEKVLRREHKVPHGAKRTEHVMHGFFRRWWPW